jgi:oligopeptide/dipeptide ABC transporter ATP-binding protein
MSAIPVPDPAHRTRRIILKGDVPSPIDPPGGCRFHTRCPDRMEICDKQEPAMQRFSDGHTAACHLYNNKYADLNHATPTKGDNP